MAVLSAFCTDVDNFVALYTAATNTNQREAEYLEETLRKLHNALYQFFLYGRDGEYVTSLTHYQECLVLLSVDVDDPEWEVSITELGTFFGTSTQPSSDAQPFQEATYATTLNINATTYKNWYVDSVTGNMTINLNNTTNGDSGMFKFTVDSTGGYTIALGTMFTEKLGSTSIDVTANAINYITWMNVDGYITCTIDVASSLLGS
jgi:hypothetical protein